MSTAASPTPTVATPQKLVTAEELLAMGDNFHGELVRGRLIEMAPAGWSHGVVVVNITRIVSTYVHQHKIGSVFAAETGFTIERMPDTVRAPDVAFARTERVQRQASRSGFFDGTPDLAIEVLSPSNTVKEIAGKVGDYLANGCGLVWVINPIRRTVTVHEPHKSDIDVLGVADTFTGGDVLPGFSSSVADFFEE